MTRILTFPWSKVAKLIVEIDTATTARPLHGRDTGKGFWLVGDEGVYLMANTTDGKLHRRRSDYKISPVYADQCDPTRMHFDQWWEAKRTLYGGDDGVDFFPLTGLETILADPPMPGLKPRRLIIAMLDEGFELGIAWIPDDKTAAAVPPDVRDLLTTIASQELGIATLEQQGSDRLDFPDVSVWSLRQALYRAYQLGRTARAYRAGRKPKS